MHVKSWLSKRISRRVKGVAIWQRECTCKRPLLHDWWMRRKQRHEENYTQIHNPTLAFWRTFSINGFFVLSLTVFLTCAISCKSWSNFCRILYPNNFTKNHHFWFISIFFIQKPHELSICVCGHPFTSLPSPMEFMIAKLKRIPHPPNPGLRPPH